MTPTNSNGTRPAGGEGAWIAAMPVVFVLLWSTGFHAGKVGVADADPFTLLFIRFGLVAAFMGALSILVQAPWPADWRLALHVALAGILLHAVYIGGVFAAFEHGMSTGVVAIIAGLQPPLTALIARPLLGEKLRPLQWVGIVLGFIGVVLVVARRVSFGASDEAAFYFAFAGLLGITLGTLHQKRFCAAMDLRTGSAIQFCAAALVMGAGAWMTEALKVNWTVPFVLALGWLVLVLSVGTVTLLYLLIRRGAATKVASLFYLVAPVTALISFFMFGETLGPVELVGMGGVVAGVALVTRG